MTSRSGGRYGDRYIGEEERERRPGNASFVTFGTEQPLDASEVRAKDRNKYLPVHLQEPRDEKGRKRFHGAFTGGFSAGYFNTVGTKEGWTPSQFVSSRSSRSALNTAKPEDYMDDEDLAEMSGRIAATEEYDIIGGTERELARKRAAVSTMEKEQNVLGQLPGRLVEDLIGPPKDPIGIKLLRQMGWREGHGVGPRAKRKRKTEEDDIYAAEHAFAPKDIAVDILKPKTDTFGLGFDPFHNAPEFAGRKTVPGAQALSEGPEKKKPKSAGRAGFGVGVFEDEEEDLDVYGSGMTNYDMIIDDDDDEMHRLGQKLGRSASKRSMALATSPSAPIVQAGLCSDGRLPIVGFLLANNTLPEPTWYPPPILPTDFIPRHTFQPNTPSASLRQPQHPTVDQFTHASRQGRQTELTADQRRDILGEEALSGPQRSVFSYLPIKEQDRLQAFIEKATKARDALIPKEPKEAKPSTLGPEVEKDTALAALKGFMPFGNDIAKQQRYRRFLEYKAGLTTDAPLPPQHLSKQDVAHELLEFSKAALIFKPLSSMMAARFTSSSVETEERKPESKDVSNEAARMKMYGRLTRTRTEWRPDKLLCKRFNVADPYASKTKKQKQDEDEDDRFRSTARLQQDKLLEKEVLNPRAMDNLMAERDRLVNEGKLGGSAVNGIAGITQEPVTEMLTREAVPGQVFVPTSAPTKQEDEGIAAEYERPPMDIFKAIFADSEDEDEDDDSGSDTRDPKLNEVLPPVEVPKQASAVHVSISVPADTVSAKLPPPTFRPLFRRKEDRGKTISQTRGGVGSDTVSGATIPEDPSTTEGESLPVDKSSRGMALARSTSEVERKVAKSNLSKSPSSEMMVVEKAAEDMPIEPDPERQTSFGRPALSEKQSGDISLDNDQEEKSRSHDSDEIDDGRQEKVKRAKKERKKKRGSKSSRKREREGRERHKRKYRDTTSEEEEEEVWVEKKVQTIPVENSFSSSTRNWSQSTDAVDARRRSNMAEPTQIEKSADNEKDGAVKRFHEEESSRKRARASAADFM
ncbi:uncharacterized protein SPPG_01472 [Spizellomyces punctatus DAOM BR117]|uniref:G-patch domain-containing protein n=1 Tax=Spizellomyces punctatus (strain DAOM BR117) TaxID=645134 RepID=A0A0L0HSZ5_SPIPD|nr:uncharacterized protein SPPG_01472 [Spizellomyces punctatus DAOM BR117]KND04025.1 hypothetical protein SPPG_01472 [Spizellomyces punctatus DAOM BR117]|eukprot:XP_016612064.1 hypothetical protein SPPG_01472 [Spizellomyces punctatus DAOM BR117]